MEMIPAPMSLIRIARRTHLMLWASYSKLLVADYDRAMLDRALPHITKAKPTLVACGTQL
jgi:hypothetical protein